MGEKETDGPSQKCGKSKIARDWKQIGQSTGKNKVTNKIVLHNSRTLANLIRRSLVSEKTTSLSHQKLSSV